MRSYFPDLAVPEQARAAYNYFREQARQYWQRQNKQLQGMLAMTAYRAGDTKVAAAIMRSLKERAINNKGLGMYWKEDHPELKIHWSYSPIETQALLIEAFAETSKDTETVDALRLLLLRNKQTN